MKPILYLPIKPEHYSQRLKKLVSEYGIETVAESLGLSINSINNKLDPNNKESQESFNRAIKRCIEENKNYSKEHIAKVIGISIEELNQRCSY